MKNSWGNILKNEGIAQIECPFSKETLNRWNMLLDAHFTKNQHEERSYATIKDLFELGIFNDFFSLEMRSILKEIMNDPTILCLHAYEIKGENNKNHVFSEAFDGWHRDIAELPGLSSKDPNYVSLFIYLSDVKMGNGEFEIIKSSFTGPAYNNELSLKVIGNVGTTFIWNRTLLHRANPNREPGRRRVLKLSIQHNYLQNDFINSKDFLELRKVVTDPYLKFLLGEKFNNTPVAHSAPFDQSSIITSIPMLSNAQVRIRFLDFIKGLWWFIRKNKRPFGP